MATNEIPLRSDFPSYKFSVELEKSTFYFDFSWNSRQQKWIVSIFDSAEVEIVSGLPVISDFNMFQRFKDQRMPKGFLYFYDTSGKSIDPGRDDLGDRVKFFYMESSDLP